MKIGQLLELKEAVLGHKQVYNTKDRGKKANYENLKKQILIKIEMIEKGRINEEKWLKDIDEYMGYLDKKLGVKIMPEEPKPGETQTDGGRQSPLIPEAPTT